VPKGSSDRGEFAPAEGEVVIDAWHGQPVQVHESTTKKFLTGEGASALAWPLHHYHRAVGEFYKKELQRNGVSKTSIRSRAR